VNDRLPSAKATPESNTHRSNLRSSGSHEHGPIGLTVQARVGPRPLLGILAERTGLIAKKSPPRLCWPSAWCWQVTRYGGLGDAEPEHEKFTWIRGATQRKFSRAIRVIRWRTWRPSDAHLASDHVIDISKSLTIRYDATQDDFRLDDHQAFEPLRSPERQQDPN
jgi:hypothetical protein